MVVQPSFMAVGAPALLPLLVAVLFSFFMLITRTLAKETDPVVLQAASGLVATAILAPLTLLAAGRAWPELSPVSVTGHEWVLLALLGLFGTAAHLVITFALRFAPSSTLAPMQYLELPFATLIGWAIFGDLPNGLAAAGIAVTRRRRPLRHPPRAAREPRRPARGLTTARRLAQTGRGGEGRVAGHPSAPGTGEGGAAWRRSIPTSAASTGRSC